MMLLLARRLYRFGLATSTGRHDRHDELHRRSGYFRLHVPDPPPVIINNGGGNQNNADQQISIHHGGHSNIYLMPSGIHARRISVQRRRAATVTLITLNEDP